MAEFGMRIEAGTGYKAGIPHESNESTLECLARTTIDIFNNPDERKAYRRGRSEEPVIPFECISPNYHKENVDIARNNE